MKRGSIVLRKNLHVKLIFIDKVSIIFRAEFIEHNNILNVTLQHILVFTKAGEKSTIGKKITCLQLFLAQL